MNPQELAEPLISWYKLHARDLPWRRDVNPYAVWVSEVMLQQTRVETAIPYFESWMRRFPSIEKLAEVEQREVLSTWEGLGYYNRARNLHRAAQIVHKTMGGKLPRDFQELMALPGIGRYTAGAIASIAFGADVPTLDGNIRRVFARIFNVEVPLRKPESERILWKLAAECLPPGKAGEYNQALMELGATVCLPRLPGCSHCPVADMCRARQLGVQQSRPVVLPKPALPHHTVSAAVILRDHKVLIAQRPARGLLGGLWEFPGGKLEPGENLHTCLQREIVEELGLPIEVENQLGVYRHSYTHFRVTVHAFFCRIPPKTEPVALQVDDLCWATLSSLAEFPMGKVDRLIATDLIACEPTINHQ